MTEVKKFSKEQLNISLTPKALAHIKQYLAQHPDKKGLRFLVKKTGCSGYGYVAELMNDICPDNDVSVAQESQLPIYLDLASSGMLNGMVVDYVKKDLGQSQLVYLNPNEKDRCGCGESFRIDEEEG